MTICAVFACFFRRRIPRRMQNEWGGERSGDECVRALRTISRCRVGTGLHRKRRWVYLPYYALRARSPAETPPQDAWARDNDPDAG